MRHDLEKVREALIAVARAHPDVLPDPPPEAILVELGDSSLNFWLRFWTIIRADDNYKLLSDLYCGVVEKCAKENIGMPYPQRDLHLRSVDAPILINTKQA